MTATDADLSRRLCELMERAPSSATEQSIVGYRSPGGWWSWWPVEKVWRNRTIDHNAMARVREELKRRGLHVAFRCKVYASLPTGTDHDVWFDLIDAPPPIQIRAAVEVLEGAK